MVWHTWPGMKNIFTLGYIMLLNDRVYEDNGWFAIVNYRLIVFKCKFALGFKNLLKLYLSE